jgi:hypothetical protein
MQNGASGMVAALGIPLVLSMIAIVVLEIAAMWRMFVKAGRPGWATLIPIYNFFVILKIAGRPGWWLLLLIVPFVNIVVAIITWIDIARAFGKGTGFGWGLALLGGIFVPILGFGDAQYRPATAQA